MDNPGHLANYHLLSSLYIIATTRNFAKNKDHFGYESILNSFKLLFSHLSSLKQPQQMCYLLNPGLPCYSPLRPQLCYFHLRPRQIRIRLHRETQAGMLRLLTKMSKLEQVANHPFLMGQAKLLNSLFAIRIQGLFAQLCPCNSLISQIAL